MRVAALGWPLLLAGCVSAEAVRPVELGRLAPPRGCRLVASDVSGHGEQQADAEHDLRVAAARRHANYVLVTSDKRGFDVVALETTPWTLGSAIVVRGDAYACGGPGGGQAPPRAVESGD